MKKVVLPLVVWLGLWWALAVCVGQPLLLPTPWQTAARLGQLAVTAEFWTSSLTTLGRVFLGGGSGIVIGVAAAALGARFDWCAAVLSPAVKVIRATPVASFIILIWLWASAAWVPVVIAALMAVPIAWSSTLQGLGEADPQLVELAAVYRFSRWKTVRLVYLPAMKNAVAAGCRSALGFAWKAGVAAEALCRPRRAMGTAIWNAKTYLETADLFAWTAAVVLLSIAVEKLLWVVWRTAEGRGRRGAA
jgi:NitT/TauT family transport system permease protein